jgi:hypothetical protein
MASSIDVLMPNNPGPGEHRAGFAALGGYRQL